MNSDVYDILAIFTFFWKVIFLILSILFIFKTIYFLLWTKLNWHLGMYHVYHMEGEFTQAGFVLIADKNFFKNLPTSTLLLHSIQLKVGYFYLKGQFVQN